jgi:RNA-directed DNA polymerase
MAVGIALPTSTGPAVPFPSRWATVRLGILGNKDGVAQAAVRIVTEPLFEASFRPSSYGFRPKRGTRQAIYDIRKWVTYGYDKVIDLDLQELLQHD